MQDKRENEPADEEIRELSDDELDDVAGGGPPIQYEGDLQP
jgi:hypothetical protein